MSNSSNKQQAAIPFAVGTRVRVKAGTKDPDFADMPLGGWTGQIQEINHEASPTAYLIAWDHYTLQNIHPVYKSRCEREGFDLARMWLGEAELETDAGQPATIEQPTALASRPLDPNDQEDRIRIALGLRNRDDPIPPVRLKSLRRYYKYLISHLAFPIRAQLGSAIGPHRDTRSPVSVVSLLDVDDYSPEETYGLICKATQKGQRIEHPLANMDVDEADPNHRLVDDYAYWLSNWA